MFYYGFGIILEAVLCFVSLVLLATPPRVRQWACIPSLFMVVYGAGDHIKYWALEYGHRPVSGALLTSYDQAVFDQAIRDRAAAALPIFAWLLVPFCLAAIAASIELVARQRRRWPMVLTGIAAVPMLVLLWWGLISPRAGL